jgi:hypothetical protein
VPTDNVVVINVATPLVSATGAPNADPPSRNCTVPVGVPPPEVTVAVNVTDCPNVEGFGDDVTVVVVLA